MRIHSDILTESDVYSAGKAAGALFDTLDETGSRSRARAFTVKLRGASNRRPNFYNGDGSFAATWDQWGVFLGILFDKDPNMTIPHTYADADEFSYRTNGRFDDVDNMPTDLSHDHRFKFAGVPFSQECTKCGAITRRGL